MTSRAERAILGSGGWILDFKRFSNVSICINFEVPARNIVKLRQALEAIDLHLTKASDEAMASLCRLDNQPRKKSEEANVEEADISGTLQITFIHNEPDLRRHIPAIPG